ncbi:LytS/YhcK type 5TM receptor domain-containing protein [Enterocloster bolteae]|uniref:LytS/YhcK type 5TM receptor domain-containing protein n=1 Tax=Enterocloster bolteae TaxID=208479 RepID=UPI00046700F7|nr:LytS/YhcK type 5TM receptor domain-containing protein [Enterocloster bolteae]UOX72543.1 histidine kinase [Enterocloster bolteae]
MSNTMFFNLLLNIGLLVLIATLLTKLPMVRSMLLEDSHAMGSRAALAVIFGLVSIFSTYTGVRAQGAIVNTRVIGVLAAGLLGGPYVGIGAAVIGGLHRYLFDIGGFTAVSCAVSTFVEGLIGSAFSKRFKAGKIDGAGVFLITALAEIGQMAIILLISRPFPAALDLVRLIAFPMIIMNALGMVVFLGTFNMVFMEEDSQFAEKMRLAMGIVDQSLPHLRKGLYSTADMEATADIIYQSTSCAAVMITDAQKILAMKGENWYDVLRDEAVLKPILGSIHDRKPTTFSYAEKTDPLYHILKNHIIVAAPLIEMDKPVGSLTMMVKKHWHTSQSNLDFASELARLFSTQLELSDLDYQKQLRRKAEFKALQSQVNPHFLYNALNTISCVCRENPDRARELILTLSSYYRQALENDQYMLSLHTELYHVASYLELEQARFEEKLVVELDVEDDLNCKVPSFILQPLVENAVRHGGDRTGARHVSISAHSVEGMAEIAVADRGQGIPREVVLGLYTGQGKGVGLSNVHKRLKSIYGEDNGLKIETSEAGSRVWFRIPLEPEEIPGPIHETKQEESYNEDSCD